MAASNFDPAVMYVLAHEGGYVNNPRDPGGPTNLGVTMATLAATRGEPVTKADVRNLTRNEAVAVYRSEYWNRAHCDELPAGLDYALFDFSVNSGVGRALRYLQTILRARKLYAGEIDGVFAGKTRAAVLALKDVAGVIRDLCAMRLKFLKGLAGWGEFGKGWARRVAEVLAVATKMAGRSPELQMLDLVDLPDPVPTVRGMPAQVAVSRTLPGRAAIATAVGVLGDQASGYAATFQGLQDIAPAFRYAFAALTVIGILAALWKAIELAQRSEASPPKPSAPVAANDDAPALEPGTVIELPPGTEIPASAEADPQVVAVHDAPAPATSEAA